MLFFSITFMDQSNIRGRAKKVVCNGVDVSNSSRDEMMNHFVDGENKLEIETEYFKVDFLIKDVYGFTF